jgi:hypothetical protein
VPESGSHVVEGRVKRGERRPGSHDEERRCHERLGQHDADPGVSQRAVENLAEVRVRTDQVDQQDAAHQRWQCQRKLHRDPDHRRTAPAPAGEQVAEWDAQNGDDHGRDAGRLH